MTGRGEAAQSPPGSGGFRDPTKLTAWTMRFLTLFLVIVCLWLIPLGIPTIFVETASTVVMIGTWTLVLRWIYRANYNSHQLGATDMAFTPGWAVGWFFVPIEWFWKPYEVMKEVWQTSSDPLGDWKTQIAPRLLGWWWALWIALWVLALANVILDTMLHIDDGGLVDLVRFLLLVPLTLVFRSIVTRIHQMQMGHWARQHTETS